jgi:lipoprotein signal peptidase
MKLNRRGWIVLVVIPAIVATLVLTWATRDTCYVGTEYGNLLGYGSCNDMIDRVIEGGK